MTARTKLAITAAVSIAALAIGGIAFAAIPDGAGAIHGCYDKQSGALRVTDTASNQPKSCTAKETALSWNQQGPAGEPGSDPRADSWIQRFGTDTGFAAAANGADCTTGEMLLTASTTKTAGGVPANGQLLPIAQHQALFALLGTTYGGDGKSTFAVPDMRAITPNHMTYSICAWGVFPS